jgi:TrmH family RNA methyltransferase
MTATPPPLDRVHLVLVRPRWASNLGSAARAMKNFGLARLTLVQSTIGSWADAWRMAVHAEDVLQAARSVDRLEDALGDATFVVATSNTPPHNTRVLTPRDVAHETVRRGELTLVFGGEIDGLGPGELLRCHAVSCIPTAPEQSSLNLAQAVCVYGAELYAAAADPAPKSPAPKSTAPKSTAAPPPADANLMHHLEAALARVLDDSAWRDADRGKHAMAELMQPFWRAPIDEHEARAWMVALGKLRRPPREG